MKYLSKLAAAASFVVAVGFVTTATAQTPGPSAPSVEEPSRRPPLDRDAAEHPRERRGPFGPRHRALVTGEFTVHTGDGLITMRVDGGTIRSISGNSLTLERLDGVSVTVEATDDTRIGKDRERASMEDLAVGDRVRVMQADAGDGFVVRFIHARSSSEEDGTRGAAGPAAWGPFA